MSLFARDPLFSLFYQVRHKPDGAVTESSFGIRNLSSEVVLCRMPKKAADWR